MYIKPGACLALAVLLSTCGKQQGSEDENSPVVFEERRLPALELNAEFTPQLSSIVEAYKVKAAADFIATRQNLERLGEAVENFLQNPNENNLELARGSWLAAHSSYEMTALHRYFTNIAISGPQALALLQVQYRIDHWPILPGYVDYVDGYAGSGVVFDTSVPVEEEPIRQLHGMFDVGEASLGFHVVEFLLWGENPGGVAPRPFSDYLPDSGLTTAQADSGMTGDQLPNNRRRRLLNLTTRLLVEDFSVFLENWNTVSPRLGEAIQDMEPAQILSLLIESITMNLSEEFLVQSLYPLLNGNFAEGIHSPYSHSTQNTMIAQLAAVENLLLEQTSADGNTTLDSMLVTLSDDFAEFFYSNLDASKECLVVLYNNVQGTEGPRNTPELEFEIVECINLLSNMIDYLEQILHESVI